MKYRKKPVIVEAFQFKGIKTTSYPEWWDKALNDEVDYGDYVIKGVKGELYTCKPDIFAQTYELIDNNRLEKLENENNELKAKYTCLVDEYNSLKQKYDNLYTIEQSKMEIKKEYEQRLSKAKQLIIAMINEI